MAEKQRRIVQADLRSADLLPAELLADLPDQPHPGRGSAEGAADAPVDQRSAAQSKRTWPSAKSAATKRAAATAAAAAVRRVSGMGEVLETR